MWEAMPDGDSTTEGQSLQILGALHCYQATKEPYYLEKAKQYFDAYHLAFYRGVPFPDPPSTALRCNWICNGKAPVLANYPLDPEYPTHGGFKGCYSIGLTDKLRYLLVLQTMVSTWTLYGLPFQNVPH